jgi:hypothetical protein
MGDREKREAQRAVSIGDGAGGEAGKKATGCAEKRNPNNDHNNDRRNKKSSRSSGDRRRLMLRGKQVDTACAAAAACSLMLCRACMCNVKYREMF